MRTIVSDRHDEIWDGVYRIIPAPGEAHWLIDEQLAELLRPIEQSRLIPLGARALAEQIDWPRAQGS